VKRISYFILRLAGWKVIGKFPREYRKCVVIEAPHTSMWDFIIGWLGFQVLDIKASFLIKKEMFVFPIGGILKRLGGIPVDRGRSNNVVDDLSRRYNASESLVIIITPEGTRKRVDHWKKGFYYIALHAKVPIVMAYLDYGKKEGGVGPVFWPSGNFQEDWKIIEDFYKGKKARHPEKFNLS
jgi:1-acyl-sn-glycerol-3-phosphate acyltransferase